MKIDECARLLEQQDKFLLLTHRDPDGDTVGSAAALCSALRRCGKTAFLSPNEQMTKKLAPYAEPLYAPEGYDPGFVVAVDVATEKMIGRGSRAESVDLCIDHHPSNSGYARYGLVDPSCAACGQIVLALIRTLCGSVSREEADLLYIALSTDCGCFQYSNTDAAALRAAAEILEAGADNKALNQIFFRRVSRARIRLEGSIYANMSFHREGKVAVALITEEMIRDAGATKDDLDDLAGLAGRAEGSVVSITIRELPEGNSRVSVRSGPSFDSCALCSLFGGGGHKMAAGCNIPLPPEQARERLLAAIDEGWA
ncbi:MAG: DHH family phosphoesterase [Oscillospiraceae bacterium]|nr:DHH family phosphoesterase [Oscillospiraceae bacterium]